MKRCMEIGVCMLLGLSVVYLTTHILVTSLLLYKMLSWI